LLLGCFDGRGLDCSYGDDDGALRSNGLGCFALGVEVLGT